MEELIMRTDFRPVRTSDYTDVESAYQAVVKSIDDAQDWYLSRKASKRIASITLRVLALVAAVLGGLVPLAHALFPEVDLSWGFLLLGMAAGFQVFDQLFGFSSAWGRFVPASLRLGMLAQQCRLEFAELRAKNAANAELLASLSRFASEAWAVMLGETGSWSTTHEESIKGLQKQVASGRREGGGT
jgi:hypothetical protein